MAPHGAVPTVTATVLQSPSDKLSLAGERLKEGRSTLGWIGRIKIQGGIFPNLGKACGITADHGRPGRHCLDDGQSKTLVKRGKKEESRVLIGRHENLIRNPAQLDQVVLTTQAAEPLPQFRGQVRPGPHQNKIWLLRQKCREHLWQDLKILATLRT